MEGTQSFTTHAELESAFLALLARSEHTLRCFDPDFAVFQLGRSDIDSALRHFLAKGGKLMLATHRPGEIQAHFPRFLTLIKDYAHRVECRQTAPDLAHLTDSFVVADDHHVLRRFHSEHVRGELALDDEAACETPLERFAAIWAESTVCLHATTLGL